jgi:hypothetical protein
MSPETDPAVVRVVRGNPTAEELAVPVAVLASVGGSSALESSVTEETLSVRGWASPAARLRSPAYGTRAGGWRASALPRGV